MCYHCYFFINLHYFRSWISDNFLPWATFVNFTLPVEENYAGQSAAAAVGSLFILLIAIVVVYAVWNKYIQLPAFFLKTELDIIPHGTKYNKFRINPSLQDNLEKALDGLLVEYEDMESIDKMKIAPTVTFKTARANVRLNRYKDMVPYDHNIAQLEAPIGENIP